MRKHRTALAAIVVFNAVVFFPVFFMGRALSPNDVFFNFSPWAPLRTSEVAQTQNSLINDPPTAYFTLMSMVRDDWRAFHWNPWVAAGIPGFGSAAAAVLSPFILLPALAVPLAWVYTAIVFLKLNASFWFAYGWLREERLGRNGAAIGALIVAGAGAYSVRWLWQITNATALFPALLWIVRRTLNGKRVSIALTALVALSYAISGFPAAIAYGGWVVVAYVAWSIAAMLASPSRRVRIAPIPRASLRPLAGLAIGLLLATPFLVPFVQLLGRSGYLEARRNASLTTVFPLSHLASFVLPDRLGNPAYKDWIGDPSLGVLNNYVESTVYLGLLAIPLALLGLFNRRARARRFWLAVALVAFAAMYGAPLVAPLMAKIPGIEYSALARLALVLPLPAGYLAAAARLRLRTLYAACALLLAFDLALFAGRFHPYLTAEEAVVPRTATTDFLRQQRPPFRIAPFFNYLWPNSAELVRLEDVRSHFGSEAAYRRMLLRIDPTAWTGTSTVITFNSLEYDFDDPLNALLGIRWYIEHREIDIIRWGIFAKTLPGVKETGSIQLRPGARMERTIRIDAAPFWSIELPAKIETYRGRDARLEVELLKEGQRVWSRAFTPAEVNLYSKVWIPLRPYADAGESVTLRVRSSGVAGWVLKGENANATETPLFYGRVTTPVIFDRELPDAKLFRNVAEVPRFRAVSKLRKLNADEFLAARDLDFWREAVITDDPVMAPMLGPARAKVTLTSYAPDEQRVATESDAPFYLASSEKLTPELGVTIDGAEAKPIGTDMLFSGLVVPAGRHEVVFTRRIARGWWWTAYLGLALLLIAGAGETRAARRLSRARRDRTG